MKEDIRVVKTKKALLESLFQLLIIKPFDKITVSEICEYALVNRVTFYTHYQDKFELFGEFVTNLKKEIVTKGLQQVSGPTPQDRFISFITYIVNAIVDRCLENKPIIAKLNSKENNFLLDIVDKSVSEGAVELLKQNTNENNLNYPPEFIAAFVVGGFSKIFSDWVNLYPNYSSVELKKNLTKLTKDLIKSSVLFTSFY